MKTIASCPSAEELRLLMLGQMPLSDTDRLASHMETCDVCVEQVRQLQGQDTLVTALHEFPTVLAKIPAGELVLKLMERVRSLAVQDSTVAPQVDSLASLGSATAEAATLPQSQADLPAAVEREHFDFLRPPQQADEIGRLGHYRVLRVIGAGGMGVVFLAEDPHLERKVALKAMKPVLAASESAKKRFVREARAMAAIDNDHIVPVYQVGEDRGLPFLAMQLLRGETLEDCLLKSESSNHNPCAVAADGTRSGPATSANALLPLGEAIRIARETATGLAAADKRGLIHRDIKPANIWIEADSGRVKILDFGLARGVDDQSALTQQGAIAGTPAYMAPEQGAGDPVDRRCDLFSLGCVMYRMCTGELPFKGANNLSILMSVMEREPRPPQELNPELPLSLAELVTRLLAKRREDRPQSAREVVDALVGIERELAHVQSDAARAAGSARSAAEREDTKPAATGTAALPRPASRRNRIIAVVSLAAILVAGLLAVGTYRVQTDKGTLVVEINDDTVEAKLKLKGLEVRDSKSGRSFTIQADSSRHEASGDYKLTDGQGLKLVVLDDDGLEVTTNEFKLTRGGKVRVRVTLEDAAGEATTESTKTEPAVSDTAPQPPVARELLRNPGCEEPMQDGKIPGWIAVLGQWRPGGQDKVTPPYEGKTFFHTFSRNQRAELIQDVNVSAFAADIDAGRQAFRFTGHVRSYRQDDPDLSRIIVEYRDATNTMVLNQYDSGLSKTVNVWKPLGDTRLAPAGTRWIRVRLISIRTHAQNNDAYHDGLSLQAVPPPVYEQGFVPLFNGKDLTGRKTHPRQPGNWTVENGILIGRGPAISHLYSERGDYENVQFRAEVRINAGGDSGQLVRTTFVSVMERLQR